MFLAATAAPAAAYNDADDDDSSQDTQSNDQGFKVHWITVEDKYNISFFLFIL